VTGEAHTRKDTAKRKEEGASGGSGSVGKLNGLLLSRRRTHDKDGKEPLFSSGLEKREKQEKKRG